MASSFTQSLPYLHTCFLVFLGCYNDTSLGSAELWLLSQVKMPLYTVSAWFLLSAVEGSIPSFVVSLSSDQTSQLPPLRLTNASRRTPLSFCRRVTPAHKGLAPSKLIPSFAIRERCHTWHTKCIK